MAVTMLPGGPDSSHVLLRETFGGAITTWSHRLPMVLLPAIGVGLVLQHCRLARMPLVVSVMAMAYSFLLLTRRTVAITPEGIVLGESPALIPPGPKLRLHVVHSIRYCDVETALIVANGAHASFWLRTDEGREFRIERAWCSTPVAQACDALRVNMEWDRDV